MNTSQLIILIQIIWTILILEVFNQFPPPYKIDIHVGIREGGDYQVINIVLQISGSHLGFIVLETGEWTQLSQCMCTQSFLQYPAGTFPVDTLS